MTQLFDSLRSLVTGMGTPKDKLTSAGFVLPLLTQDQILAAYRGDWIARKIVDVPAHDMTRAWRSWQATNDQIELLETEERRLDLKGKVLKALRWARLLGGAGLIIGIDGDDPKEPLALDQINKGRLSYLAVASCVELQAQDPDRDPLSRGYGGPKVYRMSRGSGEQVDIHPSRVVRFVGADVPDIPVASSTMLSPYGTGWGDSVLLGVSEAVRNAGLAAQGIAGLVMEAKVDIFKVKNLTEVASNERYRQGMINRFALAAQAKSLTNALIVDAEEEYEQKTVNFSALPEILQLYLEVASAAADIPATRMLNRQAKGLNNGGDADLQHYYGRLAADQELSLRPALELLDEVLIRSALDARPPEIHYSFDPLWEMSENERAVIREKDAATAKSYADGGLIPKRALALGVQNALVESGTYPGLEAALTAMGERDEADPWTGLSSQDLKDRLAAWQAGAVPYEVLFTEMQRAGIVPADATAEAYLEMIEAQGLAGRADAQSQPFSPGGGREATDPFLETPITRPRLVARTAAG